MRCVRSCKSALQRQVREAVEIASDKSHCLLNSKEEYSRCVLPTLVAEGPKKQSVQQLQEPKLSVLSPAEEEAALQQARESLKKRVRESREEAS